MAIKVADKSYEIERNDKISRSFIDHHEAAVHYRTIGQKEKAESELNIAASQNPCSPFSHLEGVAKEYYLQGHLDLAAKKISQMCGSVSVFSSMFGFKTEKIDKNKMISNFWKDIYVYAIISGKDTKEILIYAGKEVELNAKFDLAMYYLNHAQDELREKYLSEAINHQGSGCHLANLANSADRTDLIELHFNKNLKAISEEKIGIDRQMAYLQLLACHNQIRIDRLRHQHH